MVPVVRVVQVLSMEVPEALAAQRHPVAAAAARVIPEPAVMVLQVQGARVVQEACQPAVPAVSLPMQVRQLVAEAAGEMRKPMDLPGLHPVEVDQVDSKPPAMIRIWVVTAPVDRSCFNGPVHR